MRLPTEVVFVLACCVGSLSAHGGMYRGPTPYPGGPTTPSSGPGPFTPGGTPGPFTGGPAVEVDLTQWQLWWEHNKQPYLQLKRAVHGDEVVVEAGTTAQRQTRPSHSDIIDLVGALKRAMDATENRDTITSCLIALGKIAPAANITEAHKFTLLEVCKKKLSDSDQEIRETAALALGIAQSVEAEPLLHSLLNNQPAARRLIGKSEVDDRVRTFAGYALGLVAWGTNDLALKERVWKSLIAIVRDPGLASRNLRVAALNGIRLLHIDADASPMHKRLLWQVLAGLESWFLTDLGRGDQLLQAHVPCAVATLLGRGSGEDRERWKKLLTEELTAGKRRDYTILQSSALALGVLAEPQEKLPADAIVTKTLLEYARTGKDQQTRHFAWIALGKIGGDAIRTELMKELPKSKRLTKPWVALALGVLAHAQGKPDAMIGTFLIQALREEKTLESTAGIAIACGLAQAQEAAPDLRGLLARYRNMDEVGGHLCTALGLLLDKKAVPQLEELLSESIRRPLLVHGASIAIARILGPAASDRLLAMLERPDTSTARLAAIAKALELIGDRRAIAALSEILFRPSVTHLSRAFAAAALGGIADKEDLPWNTKIAVDLNYRASVETLTDGRAGILDIL